MANSVKSGLTQGANLIADSDDPWLCYTCAHVTHALRWRQSRNNNGCVSE